MPSAASCPTSERCESRSSGLSYPERTADAWPLGIAWRLATSIRLGARASAREEAWRALWDRSAVIGRNNSHRTSPRNRASSPQWSDRHHEDHLVGLSLWQAKALNGKRFCFA
jgi:hypothetical protein